MLGWLQCQLPNCFDYLYLCSLVAIKTHITCSLCFPSTESAFILFPVYVISSCSCPRHFCTMNEELFKMVYIRTHLCCHQINVLLTLTMITTPHCKIQKIKTYKNIYISSFFFVFLFECLCMLINHAESLARLTYSNCAANANQTEQLVRNGKASEIKAWVAYFSHNGL